eukprot:scaffold202926_cov86-Cyclotella_meneghiniana.AAC.5
MQGYITTAAIAAAALTDDMHDVVHDHVQYVINYYIQVQKEMVEANERRGPKTLEPENGDWAGERKKARATKSRANIVTCNMGSEQKKSCANLKLIIPLLVL